MCYTNRMAEMAKYPGLDTRGRIYYIRRRIPEDVRKLIIANYRKWQKLTKPPSPLSPLWPLIVKDKARSDNPGPVETRIRREIIFSLKTETLQEAKSRYHHRSSELEDLFQSIRAAFAGFDRVADDHDLKRIAYRYFQDADLENDQASGQLLAYKNDSRDAWEIAVEDLASHQSSDPMVASNLIREAKRLLTGNQFAADEEKAKILSGYLRRADSLLLRRDIQRLESDFADLPLDDDLFRDRSVQSNALSLASRETGGAAQITIKQAYDLHKQDLISDETHPKTLLKINYVEQLIYHIFGPDTLIQSIDRMAARRYVDIVSKLPANWGKKKEFEGLAAPEVAQKAEAQNIAPCRPRTAKGNIDRLDTFFEWALREEITDKNPVKGLSRPFAKKAKKEPKRQSFTIEDLKLIFGSDYRNHARPYGVSKKEPLPRDVIPSAAHFWVPLISLFSGMRLSEACQLTLAEVHKIEGITCFEVLDFDNEALEDDLSEEDLKILRSKKSTAALRVIPVSEELKRLGILKHIEQIKQQGADRLFPDLTPDSNGYIASPVSRWFNRRLRDLGITSKRKVFHSLRHTFRDALRRAEVSRDVVVSIGGWSKKGFDDVYGDDPIVAIAQRHLSRIEYGDLDLSHLYARGTLEQEQDQ
ncbi:MAG: site-specific integrase [Cohaesibacter sp.]|nr:site-specific integrase [Cohaesibacter sp.]